MEGAKLLWEGDAWSLGTVHHGTGVKARREGSNAFIISGFSEMGGHGRTTITSRRETLICSSIGNDCKM